LETHLESKRAAPTARPSLFRGGRLPNYGIRQELIALSISIIRNKPDRDSPISLVVARSLILSKTNWTAERSVGANAFQTCGNAN
jgi:hypothetical protein